MNYTEFKNRFQDQPYILSRDIAKNHQDPQALRNQLVRWKKKGLIISLKKGLYILNQNDRKSDIDPNFIANICYEPSYVSLESALNFYGLIPEKVSDITSVTTLKTARFSNALGNFIYQRIKEAAFRGFKKLGQGPASFFMAEPEKAVVDFLYLNLCRFDTDTREVLEHSYRFQNIDQLRTPRMIELGELFHNKKLMRVLKEFCRWVKEERHD